MDRTVVSTAAVGKFVHHTRGNADWSPGLYHGVALLGDMRLPCAVRWLHQKPYSSASARNVRGEIPFTEDVLMTIPPHV